MTPWPSLRAALADLAGKHPVEQAKALMARGVDWSLGEQSREADQARAGAVFAAIFAQKHADANNPALDAIRAANERRATERREEYEDIIRGGVEISNKLLPPVSSPLDAGPAYHSAGRPDGGSLPTNSTEGIAEAREAARHHWNCKRNAA